MKQKTIYLITMVLFIWLSILPCYSQDKLDTEKLLERINFMRAVDTQSMSSSEERIYNKTLLNLYEQFISSLKGKNNDEVNKHQKELNNARTMVFILKENLNIIVETNPTLTNKVQTPTPSPIVPERQIKDNIQPTIKASATPQPVQISSASNTFTDAPNSLIGISEDLAGSILDDIMANEPNPEDQVTSAFPQLFSFSVANTVLANQKDNPVSTLEPLRFFVETARTDKQIGASSSTGAATSATEKPGFPFLLGVAIENGLIERNIQDSVLTLSTSPAALFSLAERDITKAYKTAGIFNKIGVSASFNINTENPLLNNATRSQLREYSVRFRFYGDRSSRSRKLERIWNETMTPAIQAILTPLNTANITLDDVLKNVRNENTLKLKVAIKAKIETDEFKALSVDVKKGQLKNIILNFLKTFIVEPVKDNRIPVSETTKLAINKHFQELVVAQENLKVIRKEVKNQLDEFFKGPLGTVAYTNHRNMLGNYSEFKVLFEHNDTFFKPLKLIANGGFSFYHKPNAMMNQKKTRDVNVSLSLEGKWLSPFNVDNEDLSQITYSFTGRYARMFENKGIEGRKADLADFQFLTNIPFLRGLIFPFSVTYSNATELERKRGVRVNFGIKLDTDKLFELANFNRRFR